MRMNDDRHENDKLSFFLLRRALRLENFELIIMFVLCTLPKTISKLMGKKRITCVFVTSHLMFLIFNFIYIFLKFITLPDPPLLSPANRRHEIWPNIFFAFLICFSVSVFNFTFYFPLWKLEDKFILEFHQKVKQVY